MVTDWSARPVRPTPLPTFSVRRTRAAVRLAAAAAVLVALPGCASTRYLMQAAVGEWQVMHDRRSIVDVIDEPNASPPLIRELGAVRAARRFASQQLGLPDNDSYRSYVNLHRRYVVWNVVAAPQFSVQPKLWCFPIAGCVAYRGYFHERAALSFAAHLKRRGYDVMVEGVPAYSTLGRLPDPVMSTMMRYGSDELAAMIFHELAHQLLYVPNDSRFDEAFAMTVENTGLKRWLRYRHESQRIALFEHLDAADREFAALLRRTRSRLAHLYASGMTHRQMLGRKQAIFTHLAAQLRALEERLQVHAPLYQRWIRQGLNNADLVSVGTYYDCLPGFEQLLRREHGNLPRFYAAARRLAHEPKATRDRALCRSGHGSRNRRLRAKRAGPAAQTPAAAHRTGASAP
jgi:predicted aminopeptidase